MLEKEGASQSGDRAFMKLPPMNYSQHLPPIRNVEAYSRGHAHHHHHHGSKGKNGCCPRDKEGRRSSSPKSVVSEGSVNSSSRNGLEMLLDAGIESERRQSGGSDGARAE